jgi:hypothetical protein
MTIYKCNFCNRQYKNSQPFTRHTNICKFIHISSKERNITTEYIEKNPSLEDIYKLVVNLCIENTNLKQRIEKLENTNFINKKKTIEDYLSMIPKDIISFSNWVNELVISDENLKVLFSSNLIECLKNVLESSFSIINIDKLPLRAFSQKQNTIYIFDENKWETIETSHFANFISVLSHRIFKKYLEWKKINQEAIDSNENLQELNFQYMQKANGSGKSIEYRCSEIKKWIFLKIQKSLKNVEKE